jgi:hypothetical protein
LLDCHALKADVKEGIKIAIEIERVKVLIKFGSEVHGSEFVKQMHVISFGCFGIDSKYRFHVPYSNPIRE